MFMMKVPKVYLSTNFRKTGVAPYVVQTNHSSRKKVRARFILPLWGIGMTTGYGIYGTSREDGNAVLGQGDGK